MLYGSSLVTDNDEANGIAIHNGILYITGKTTGELYSGAHQGMNDLFLLKIDPSQTAGNRFAWTTPVQIGTIADDAAFSVAVDTLYNHIYVVGYTFDNLSPEEGNNPGGSSDIFLAGWDVAGSPL